MVNCEIVVVVCSVEYLLLDMIQVNTETAKTDVQDWFLRVINVAH